MKKNVPSWLALSLSTTLVLSVGAGCAKKAETPSASPAPSATAAAPKEPLKFSWQHQAWDAAPPEGNLVIKEIEKQSNTKPELIYVPYQQYEERLNVQLASKDLPSVLQVDRKGSNYSPIVLQAIKSGVFMDLTSFVESKDFATKYPELAKIPKWAWELGKVDGKIYGIPSYVGDRATASAIIYRKDLFDAKGIKEPTTLDELTDAIIKLSEPPKRYGLRLSTDDFSKTNIQPVANAFTGVADWAIDKDGNFTFQSFMPEYKDFLTWLKKLYDAKAIDPEFALKEDHTKFDEGKSAVQVHNHTSFFHVPDKGFSAFKPEAGKEATAWAAKAVKGPKGYTIAPNPGVGGFGLINAKFPANELPRLFEFFNWCAKDEIADGIIGMGIDGVHNEMKDGVKVQNQKYKDERINVYGGLRSYRVTEPWQYLQSRLTGRPEFAQRMKEISEFANKTVDDPNSTLKLNTILYSSATFDSKWTSVTKDLNANRVKVVMGAMSLADWDKYVAEVTSSPTYKQIVEEYKKDYLSKKK